MGTEQHEGGRQDIDGARRGTMVRFAANGRGAEGYLSLPPGGTGPGVLVIQEWWGLVDHVRDVADRFAAAGFVALAPDLYHGERTTSPDQAEKLFMALDIARAGKELHGAAEFLRAHEAVAPRRVGVVGFCMGGQLALFAACEHPEAVDAAVDFYGIHPKVALDTSRLRAPVLAHFGKHDASIPLDRAEALIEEIRGRGVPAEMHVYDAGHAFLNDQRPNAYDADAARLAWDRTLGFLRAHLVEGTDEA